VPSYRRFVLDNGWLCRRCELSGRYSFHLGSRLEPAEQEVELWLSWDGDAARWLMNQLLNNGQQQLAFKVEEFQSSANFSTLSEDLEMVFGLPL